MHQAKDVLDHTKLVLKAGSEHQYDQNGSTSEYCSNTICMWSFNKFDIRASGK